MKITEVRTRVVSWKGKTVPLPPHFCTNPMDLLALPEASMSTFTFHGWLIVEIFTDAGLVGVGNAALSPRPKTNRNTMSAKNPLAMPDNAVARDQIASPSARAR